MGFAVNTKFTGRDLISRTFSRMGRSADKFGDKSSRAFKQANRQASRFKDITKGILAATGIQRVLGALSRGTGAVAGEFVNFDQAVISAAAKFKDINLATEEGRAKLQQLKMAARETGAATQFSAGQAAEGLDFLAMAGFNASQAMAALPGVVDLATVANVDLARATDIASDSLGAFGLMTENTAQLQKNFNRINDVMALTMSRTNTSMEALFESIQKGGPTFTSSGQSLESFNALVGIMANAGLKGAESGTQLRNVMLRLADPTKEAQKVLNGLNIKTKDSHGNFRDVVDILADFEKGLKGMGTQQRAAALSTVFGARAITGVNILLKEGTTSIRSFRGELENAAGSSEKMAEIMRTSIGNRLKSLSSAAIEFGFKIFTAFETKGVSAIDSLTQAIRDLDPKPLINGINFIIDVISKLYNIIKFVAPELGIVIGAFVTYGAILKGLAVVSAIQNFIVLISTVKSLAAAQVILNAAMTANPIGLIVAGVAGIIALFVFLERKFGVLSYIFKVMKTWFDVVVGTLKSLGAGKVFEFIGDIAAKIGGSVGTLGTALRPDETSGPAGTNEAAAPNKAEVAARKIAFEGQLNIAGAPAGSIVEGTTRGAAPVKMQLLGANP